MKNVVEREREREKFKKKTLNGRKLFFNLGFPQPSLDDLSQVHKCKHFEFVSLSL